MHARLLISALSVAALVACSGGGAKLAPVPAAPGALRPEAKTTFTLVLHDSPVAIKSLDARAISEVNGASLYSYPDLPSGSCKQSNGVYACTASISANPGLNEVEVRAYVSKNQDGRQVFDTYFLATAKKGGATTVDVPNAIYVKAIALTGFPQGSLTKGPLGDTHVWFMQETGSGQQIVAANASGAKYYDSPLFPGGYFNGYISIVAGMHGTLWFTHGGFEEPESVGSITTAGTLTLFPATTYGTNCPGQNVPVSIAFGPDGKAWFNEFTACARGGAVGSITATGTIADYPLPVDKNNAQVYTFGTGQRQIVGGPNGLYSFAEGCVLAAGYCQQQSSIPTVIHTSTGGGHSYVKLQPMPSCGDGFVAIAGDKNVWLMEPCVPGNKPGYQANTLTRITPSGKVTPFYTGFNTFNDMNVGPDGNLYMTDQGGVERFVVQGPHVGEIDYYASELGSLTGSVAAGPDGYLYVTSSPLSGPHGWLSRIKVPAASK